MKSEAKIRALLADVWAREQKAQGDGKFLSADVYRARKEQLQWVLK